jgi:hypothetical protein
MPYTVLFLSFFSPSLFTSGSFLSFLLHFLLPTLIYALRNPSLLVAKTWSVTKVCLWLLSSSYANYHLCEEPAAALGCPFLPSSSLLGIGSVPCQLVPVFWVPLILNFLALRVFLLLLLFLINPHLLTTNYTLLNKYF